MLRVNQLDFYYGHHRILKDITFELTQGKSVCLLGKNGAGKSTLFKTLLGIYSPSKGSIYIENRQLSTMSQKEIAGILSYIPQTQKSSNHFTVFEMVLMGRTAKLKSFQQPGKRDNQIVEEALELLSVSHLRHRVFSRLSGGEQQLVVIARSIVQESRIFIMDEPCANLDYSNQLMVLKMIRRLTDEGYLIIQATHDPNHALQYADQVLLLQGGKLVANGHPETILTSERLSELYQAPIDVFSLTDQRKVCLPSCQSQEVTQCGIYTTS